MNKLISGIGQDNFKRLFDDEPGDLFEILKNKLFSLITCEYDGYDEILRLDSSFKSLIEEIYSQEIKNENKQIEIDILEDYFLLIRKITIDFDIDRGFHSCINNHFWFKREVFNYIAYNIKMINCNFHIFNFKSDLNNIYNLINSDIYINYKSKVKIYIDDMSITLPTLLYFTDNFYYEYIIIEFFEKLFENIKKKKIL